MVIVDIRCHFGHAYLIKIDKGQSCRFYESFGKLVRYQMEIFFILLSVDEKDEIVTLKEIKDRIESTEGDRWKTFFREVETIEFERIEKSLKAYASTTSDDIRYDLTFFTPSGLEVRVKVI